MVGRMSAQTDSPSPPRLALTRQEAAEAIGVSLDTFERYCQGAIRCVYIGSKRIYPIDEIQKWLDREATP
jgi:predicted site-specific integrase-resolvase